MLSLLCKTRLIKVHYQIVVTRVLGKLFSYFTTMGPAVHSYLTSWPGNICPALPFLTLWPGTELLLKPKINAVGIMPSQSNNNTHQMQKKAFSNSHPLFTNASLQKYHIFGLISKRNFFFLLPSPLPWKEKSSNFSLFDGHAKWMGIV